ncbi:DNA-directed RNA polymerase-like protein [Dinothrombium tinctorium]|uniref:DNA-directed RNA polymerase n=1 Tax=Dinothrombium tinctorium TaxID=1965070 RepID=A0A3S3R141_9ACAR|nr:DNA-directed RNA polymerase-like protein [Dinothrombium tinctorium]RWS17595.1 DNA-directed RNA polymerase-like protein [Dinothrombium tinctorium]RWS17603.1 DNA-directed RNA polymerase-like protein [Dinothrombium tinctorium]
MPQLLKLIEEEESIINKQKAKISPAESETEVKTKPVKDFLSAHKKYSKTAERYRKEIVNNAIEKQRLEAKLLGTHLQYVLKGYLHACINGGSVDKAHNTLIWYRHKFKRDYFDKENIIDSSLYNVVLKGWANIGRLSKVQEIFRLMKLSKVSPDMQSFAYYLLCIINQKEFNENLIQQVLNNMREKGLNPEILFLESSLDRKSRHLMMETLRKVDSNLNFEKPQFDNAYETQLLNSFKDSPRTAYVHLNESVNFEENFQLQKTNELEGYVKIESVYGNNVMDENSEYFQSCWKKSENLWKKAFTAAFERNVKALKNKLGAHQGMNIIPYLTSMKTEAFVDIMVNEMYFLGRDINSYSPPLSYLYSHIAKKAMHRYLTHMYSKQVTEMDQICKELLRYYESPELIAKYLPRELVHKVAKENDIYLKDDVCEMAWSLPALEAVGKFLYNIILHEAQIDANILNKNSKSVRLVPAFYTVYVSRNLKTFEELRANIKFTKLYQLANLNVLFFNTNELPMYIPPIPWINHQRGGYLYAKTDFIREPGSGEEGLLGIKLTPKANLNAVYDSLNALSYCPWKINGDVLDIIISVFKNNGNVKLDIPVHQSALDPLPKVEEKMAKSEKMALIKRRHYLKQKRMEMYSLWCDCLYKLSIANHFRHKVFWFPQNLDFRGRVYAVPPHLNHLGSDVSRGILLFAKGKPLGPKGLDWLKIHVINLTGTKKRESLEERLNYANEIMPLILDSADNPLEGKKWWMDSEEPWQTLACCIEIAKASRSPNPEEYISYFPVHQDGSCNGLQHYAALGRDEEGAHSVNLEPDLKPNDVYATVAAIVEKERQEDSAADNQTAKVLNGFISRKVVKQTVMTYVYGVTRYGARLQILKRLKDIDEFPESQSWISSHYLTQKVFNAIQQMFTSTRKIQEWFTSSAGVIAKVLGLPVQWVTPLGFPVVQPYFKGKSQKLNNSEIFQTGSEILWKPNVMKQKNAFPPNFIHSLDSTHMMLTAIHCEQKGIIFAAVHDSYWTHPCTLDAMNVICRKQFVALHSEPILDKLSQLMVEKYEPVLKTMFGESSDKYEKHLTLFKSVPQTGSFKLENVLKSVYFFS